MPTAAERAAKVEADRAAAAAAAAQPQAPDATPDQAPTATIDIDADLLAMSLFDLRREAKRLMGGDYDHDADGDRERLIDMARAGRAERRAYYASRRQAEVDHARGVIRGTPDD